MDREQVGEVLGSESEEELKSLMRVKEESGKSWLKT